MDRINSFIVKVVDAGNMLKAIPWRVGVEGKLEKHYENGPRNWSFRVETGQTLSFQLAEGGTVSFRHSDKSGSTDLTLKR